MDFCLAPVVVVSSERGCCNFHRGYISMPFSLFDVVALTEDIPIEQLRAGMRGYVIEAYSSPVEGYEVEFSDGQGQTIALLSLSASQLRVVDT